MSDETPASNGPLSWRDVYKAVGDAEERILAAIGDVNKDLTDHESRIRIIERDVPASVAQNGKDIANHELRLAPLESSALSTSAAGIERSRLANIANRTLVGLILVSNFVVGLVVVVVNALTERPPL